MKEKSCLQTVFPLLPQKELCNEMESKLHTYTDVKNAIHRMLESSNVVRGSSTEHSMSILEQKWASVYSKVHERKVDKPFTLMCYPSDFYSLVYDYIWVFSFPTGKAHRRTESGQGVPQQSPGTPL